MKRKNLNKRGTSKDRVFNRKEFLDALRRGSYEIACTEQSRSVIPAGDLNNKFRFLTFMSKHVLNLIEYETSEIPPMALPRG